MDVGWPAARALLEQIYEEYQDAGAPYVGVDMLSRLQDESTGRHAAALIRELVRMDFLEVEFESADGPRMVRPAPAAMKMLGGWPAGSAGDALAELVQALDREIDQTCDAAKRSKLVQVRDGLVGVGRDIFISYVEKKIGAEL